MTYFGYDHGKEASMPKFRVTIDFERKNPRTARKEKSRREGELYAPDAATAKRTYVKQFEKNEPTRTKVGAVTVKKIGD